MHPHFLAPRALRVARWAAMAVAVAGGAAQAQSVIANFSGVDLDGIAALNGFTLAPPDSNGAIGPQHFVELINGAMAVYSRSGAQQFVQSDSQFWLGAGIAPALVGQGLADPRIQFDPLSQRWFATEMTLGNASQVNNSLLLAVSATANPLGAWKGVAYKTLQTSTFADYPTLGIDANAVYVGTNNFNASGVFTGITVDSLSKASLLAATPTVPLVTTVTQGTSTAIGLTPMAVSNYSPNQGSAPGLVLGVGASGYNVVKLTPVNNAGTASASFGSSRAITVANDGDPTLARQPDGSRVIDAMDTRFSGSVFRVGNLIYAARAINSGNRTGSLTAAGTDAIHWLVLDATAGTVVQEGTITDGLNDLWQPSIAANAKGDVVIGYNKAGPALNVGAYAAVGHTVGGSLSFSAQLLLKAGTVSNYTDGFGDATFTRWGDYSATTPDPTNADVFWTIQEVATGPTTWGTQISAINVAAAVPEPQSWALLLAGGGLLGWRAGRCKGLRGSAMERPA